MALDANQVLGLRDEDRVGPGVMRPDTRNTWKQFSDAMASPVALGVVFLVMAALLLVIPGLWLPELVAFTIMMFAFWRKSGMERLPMRMPSVAGDGEPDFGDPIPGTQRQKHFISAGIAFLGNMIDGLEQLWASKRDLLTHMMVFGGTGSGKTEVMVSIVANYMVLSSGLAYIDPKAAPKLAFQIYSMCRMFWRDHDFRVMNFMTTVRRSPNGFVHPLRNSNTSNPVNRGSPENCTSILTSLIAASGGDNQIFQMNAQNLMAGLMRGLVELRDEHREPLDVRVIRASIASKEYVRIATEKPLRPTTKESMQAFLKSVGWVEGTPYEKMPPSFHQQYGYAQAYFSQPLNNLTDSYGYIYARSSMGEIDYEDIIKQRRVLVVMLPSLSKSPTELSGLGKVILGGVRNAISVGLGDRIEGTVEDVIDSSTMAAKYPFCVDVDEYAAIPTEGFVQVLTQGRGLGIAAIIGTQDYAGLKKASETEAQQAVENSTIKLFGKMDTGESTFELLKKIAGEAHISTAEGSEIREGTTSWREQMRARYNTASRVELLDLQRQIEGEFHIYFRGSLMRATVFYANPRLRKNDQLRINAMLPIRWPTEKEARDAAGQYMDAVRALREWMKDPIPADAFGESADLKALSRVLSYDPSGFGKERGGAAVAFFAAIQAADVARAGGGGGRGNAAKMAAPEPAPQPAPEKSARAGGDVGVVQRDEAEGLDLLSARTRISRSVSGEDVDLSNPLGALERKGGRRRNAAIPAMKEKEVVPPAPVGSTEPDWDDSDPLGSLERLVAENSQSQAGAPGEDLPSAPESVMAEDSSGEDLRDIAAAASTAIPVSDQETQDGIDALAGVPGVVDRAIEEITSAIDYPKPPTPEIIRTDDAQDLLAKMRAKMFGGA